MTDAPFDSFALVGALLDGQYRVDEVAGEGNFGVVYKGWHVNFEQPVAIKALKIPDTVGPELQRSLLAKFHEEARLSYMLSQQSLDIVRSIGFGELTTPSGLWAPFLVLEWLDGASLAADLEERRARRARGRSLEEAIALLAPAARGLAYAHSKRVAHRDVKPANMFLAQLPGSSQRTIKLLDFGIAKVIEEGTHAGSAPAKATAFTSFTPFYAAPEQFDPRMGATGPWTDVYGLALVLTEVLTDQQPSSGDAMTLLRHATDPARRPTPRALGFAMSDGVHAIFARALAVDPKQRFADVGAFWGALVAASQQRPEAFVQAAGPSGLEDSATRTAAMPNAPAQPRSTARMAVARPTVETAPMAAAPARGSHGTMPMAQVAPRAAPTPFPAPSAVPVALGSSGSTLRTGVPAGPATVRTRRGSTRAIWIACIVGVLLAALSFALVAAKVVGAL